jgi:hypothetical protein
MSRRCRKLLLAAGFVVASATIALGEQPLRRTLLETRVVPPLADPRLVPGVGRCTSDGVCTVTDAAGTRSGSRLAPSR